MRTFETGLLLIIAVLLTTIHAAHDSSDSSSESGSSERKLVSDDVEISALTPELATHRLIDLIQNTPVVNISHFNTLFKVVREKGNEISTLKKIYSEAYISDEGNFEKLLNVTRQLKPAMIVPAYQIAFNLLKKHQNVYGSTQLFQLAVHINDTKSSGVVQSSSELDSLISTLPSVARDLVMDGLIHIEMREYARRVDADTKGNAYTKERNDGSYQIWKVLSRENGNYFSFKNLATGLVLDANGKKKVSANIENDGSYQRWSIVLAEAGYIALRNKATGYALDGNGKGDLYVNSYSNTNHYQQWNTVRANP